MKKKTVIKYFKGVTNTAQALKISKQAVSQWPEIVPINQAWKIERISRGKVAFVINDYKMRAIQ